jgi:hypothetical protein
VKSASGRRHSEFQAATTSRHVLIAGAKRAMRLLDIESVEDCGMCGKKFPR